jgi:hypothetical protein
MILNYIKPSTAMEPNSIEEMDLLCLLEYTTQMSVEAQVEEHAGSGGVHNDSLTHSRPKAQRGIFE